MNVAWTTTAVSLWPALTAAARILVMSKILVLANKAVEWPKAAPPVAGWSFASVLKALLWLKVDVAKRPSHPHSVIPTMNALTLNSAT